MGFLSVGGAVLELVILPATRIVLAVVRSVVVVQKLLHRCRNCEANVSIIIVVVRVSFAF